jgi:hypothetical protein
MKLPTETVSKFLSNAGNIIGRNSVQWAHLKYAEGSLHIGLSTQLGTATLDIPTEGKDKFAISIPYNILIELSSKSKIVELSVDGNRVLFKKNKTHTGYVNGSEYEQIHIDRPKEHLKEDILSLIPKTTLGIAYNNIRLVAQIKSSKKDSKILTGDGFHFAIAKAKNLGDFDIPVEYVGYCKSLFGSDVKIGSLDNFFVAWNSCIRLRLPLVDPASNVPFDQACNPDLLKNVVTSFTVKATELSKKLSNVMLTYSVDEDRVILTPDKKGVKLSLSSNVGKNEEYLECKVKTNGKKIILSPSNFDDLVSLANGDVTVEFIEMQGQNKICSLRTNDQILYMVASSQ